MARPLANILRRRGEKPRAFAYYHNEHGKRRQKAKRFAIGTSDEAMRAWITKTEGQHRRVAALGDSLAADVEEVLARPHIVAMPSYAQIAAYLALWREALGATRPRASITKDQIELVIQAWLKTYAPATVYHRRSALLLLFRELEGPGGRNPVLGTTVPEAWTPRDQSEDYALLERIVATMPEERYLAKGITAPSAAKIAARVLMHTGARPCDIALVQRHDVDLMAGTVEMPPGKKGSGTDRWTCYLSPEALAAWRDLDAANLYRAFKPAAVSHSFKRAARRVLGHDTKVHLYSLRHTVGADSFRGCRDTATVGRLLGHAPGSRMAEQYSRGAHAEVDRAAIDAMSVARLAAVARSTAGAATAATAAAASEGPRGSKVLPQLLPRLVKRSSVNKLRAGR